jgi:hypothetical protein
LRNDLEVPGIWIDQKSLMDKNVGKRLYLTTLLSMNAKQKAIKLFKENQGLLRTAEAIRLGIHLTLPLY